MAKEQRVKGGKVMLWFRKLFCILFGHNYFMEEQIDNGQSVYGCHICNRCEKKRYYQWDR